MLRMDPRGRIILPNEFRERLDLTTATVAIVREEDGSVIIKLNINPDDTPRVRSDTVLRHP